MLGIKQTLTKIINSMGKFGAVETLTFPFTATADGIVIAVNVPPNNTASYVYVSEDNNVHARIYSTGGITETLIFPVKKGCKYAISSSSNYSFSTGIRLYPFIGGGTA